MKKNQDKLAQYIAIDAFDQALNLISNGVGDINSTDRSGATLLMRAAVCNDELIVKKLIEMDADVNIIDDAKYSALHFAAQNGNQEIAAYLIEAGADVNAQDENGNSPLLSAPSRSTPEGVAMTDLLIKNGANVSLENNYGVSYENMLKQ